MRDTTARTAAGGRKRMLNQNLKKNCYFGVKKHSHVLREVTCCCLSFKAVLGELVCVRSRIAAADARVSGEDCRFVGL